MVIGNTEFLYRASLDGDTFEVWLWKQWLIPQDPAAELEFSEPKLARAPRILHLQNALGVNAAGVILHLLGQIRSRREALGGKMLAADYRAGEWGANCPSTAALAGKR
jgi:hypothetical protein